MPCVLTGSSSERQAHCCDCQDLQGPRHAKYVFTSYEYSKHLSVEQNRLKEALTRLMVSLVNSVNAGDM